MGATAVRADMAGTIWKIEVAAGQAVAAGDTLFLVESMKMEIPVEAPRAGTVAAILVSEGEAVREGDVLAELAAP